MAWRTQLAHQRLEDAVTTAVTVFAQFAQQLHRAVGMLSQMARHGIAVRVQFARARWRASLLKARFRQPEAHGPFVQRAVRGDLRRCQPPARQCADAAISLVVDHASPSGSSSTW